jgi:hypothetical protein
MKWEREPNALPALIVVVVDTVRTLLITGAVGQPSVVRNRPALVRRSPSQARQAASCSFHRFKNIETAGTTENATRSRRARIHHRHGSGESSVAPAWPSHS